MAAGEARAAPTPHTPTRGRAVRGAAGPQGRGRAGGGLAAATAGQLTPAAPAEEGEAGRRARFPVRPRGLLGGAGVALSFCYVAVPLPSPAEGRGPSSPFAEAKHPPAHRRSAQPPAPVLTVRLASGPGRAEGPLPAAPPPRAHLIAVGGASSGLFRFLLRLEPSVSC